MEREQYSTNADGKAVLSTELIEAERLKVNQLETAGVINDKLPKLLSINQNKIEVKDKENKIKVKTRWKLGSIHKRDIFLGFQNITYN